MEFLIKIDKLDCIKIENNKIVVKRIHWSIIGKLNSKEKKINIISEISTNNINDSNFIDYQNLTEDIINSWISDLSLSNTKENLQKLFEEDQSSEINPNLPWN